MFGPSDPPEVCHNVHTDLLLQPFQGEHVTSDRSANGEIGAWLDVAAQNFWRKDHLLWCQNIQPICSTLCQFLDPCQNATGTMKRIRRGNMKNEWEDWVWFIFTFGCIYSGRVWDWDNNHSLQENSIINCRQVTRTLFLVVTQSLSLLCSTIMCLRGTRSSIPIYNTNLYHWPMQRQRSTKSCFNRDHLQQGRIMWLYVRPREPFNNWIVIIILCGPFPRWKLIRVQITQAA